jgi:transcriptional regulator with XRE-family HTH domain
MTGTELKALREEARIRVNELAAVMVNSKGVTGVHPSWISQLEARTRVTRTAERRYLEALATCTNVEKAA